jgi:predicted site-specific integrase-resolvase
MDYSELEEAGRLHIALRTLRRWRRKGYGPTPTIIGRRYYYTDENEAAFLKKAERPLQPPPAPRRRRA